MQVEEAIALQRKLEADILLLIRNYCDKTGLVVRQVELAHGAFIASRASEALVVRCTVETP